MNRALTLGLLLLAGQVNAADLAVATKHFEPSGDSLGPKTQWAPSGNFSALHGRAVFRGEVRSESRPYVRARGQLASDLGIFLSRDSTGAQSYLSTPNGMGPWSYAGLNPTRFTDPDGREYDLSSDAVERQLDEGIALRERCGAGHEAACELMRARTFAGGAGAAVALGPVIGPACTAAPQVCAALGYAMLYGTLSSGRPVAIGVVNQANDCYQFKTEEQALSCGFAATAAGMGVATLARSAGPALMTAARPYVLAGALELAPMEVESAGSSALATFSRGASIPRTTGPLTPGPIAVSGALSGPSRGFSSWIRDINTRRSGEWMATPEAREGFAEYLAEIGVPGEFAGMGVELEAGAALQSRAASFGSSTSSNYRATFFAKYPALEGQVVVHHAVEQQCLTCFPGVVTESEMHSFENLRGIPKEINSDLHLSEIRIEWNRFYRETPVPTKEQLLRS